MYSKLLINVQSASKILHCNKRRCHQEEKSSSSATDLNDFSLSYLKLDRDKETYSHIVPMYSMSLRVIRLFVTASRKVLC